MIKLDAVRKETTIEDLPKIKDQVSKFVDEERGWNVFHYVAHWKSDEMMKILVDFLGKLILQH